LRIGFDAHKSCWDREQKALHIRTAIWRSVEQPEPKTKAGIRTVEISKVLNDFLSELVGKRTGFLLTNHKGEMMRESTLRQASFAKTGMPGAHSLRRFRITLLRKHLVPEEIIDYFVGHKSHRNLNDIYSSLAADADNRRSIVETVGLGFTVKEA
jgi:hypothetical protein